MMFPLDNLIIGLIVRGMDEEIDSNYGCSLLNHLAEQHWILDCSLKYLA